MAKEPKATAGKWAIDKNIMKPFNILVTELRAFPALLLVSLFGWISKACCKPCWKRKESAKTLKWLLKDWGFVLAAYNQTAILFSIYRLLKKYDPKTLISFYCMFIFQWRLLYIRNYRLLYSCLFLISWMQSSFLIWSLLSWSAYMKVRRKKGQGNALLFRGEQQEREIPLGGLKVKTMISAMRAF